MTEKDTLSKILEFMDLAPKLQEELKQLREEVAELRQKEYRVLDTEEAAAFFRVSPATVRRWAQDGRIPAIMTRGRYRFPIHGLIERDPTGRVSPRGSTSLF